MGKLRDFQRSRVYAWEERERNKHPGSKKLISFDEALKLVRRVCELYGTKVPLLKRNNRRRNGIHKYHRGSSEIHLPDFAFYPQYVVHEAAHAVVYQWARAQGLKVAGHGPEFVRVLMDLHRTVLGWGEPAGHGTLKVEAMEGEYPRMRRERVRRAAGPKTRKLPKVITREYKHRTYSVLVVGPKDFELEGIHFKSLTAVAKAITGYSSISGPHFFRLDQDGPRSAESASEAPGPG